MTIKSFLGSQIVRMTPIEKVEWGFVFYKERDLRYSIDTTGGMVIVERKTTRDWTCVYSYAAKGWRRQTADLTL